MTKVKVLVSYSGTHEVEIDIVALAAMASKLRNHLSPGGSRLQAIRNLIEDALDAERSVLDLDDPRYNDDDLQDALDALEAQS